VPFFSFERSGIVPDMVILSKSISGYGAPMSLLLIKPELDQWQPGEHDGTFRGYQLAFVGATAALRFRQMSNLEEAQKHKAAFLHEYLTSHIKPLDGGVDIRGVGMIWGIDLAKRQDQGAFAKRVSSRCFNHGLIIERVGRDDTVLKIMPPLTIDLETLRKGCSIIRQAIQDCLAEGA